jgi:hypothetical protein
VDLLLQVISFVASGYSFDVESLCTALTPSSKRNCNIVVRSFLVYLGTEYLAVNRLEQLRREPHILGWMAHLRAQNSPLATATCIGRLFALRTIFHELARKRAIFVSKLFSSACIIRLPQHTLIPSPPVGRCKFAS